MEFTQLENCHDCGVVPGQPHQSGCDVERCSVCGGRWISCGCSEHDLIFARWTGIWPGWAEAMALGLICKWDNGWKKCKLNEEGARPDLNTFLELGYDKIFFVKPSPIDLAGEAELPVLPKPIDEEKVDKNGDLF